MSKKYRSGRLKAKLQPNSVSKKLRKSGKRINKIGSAEAYFKYETDYVCAVCGRIISTPYMDLDGRIRCMICVIQAL